MPLLLALLLFGGCVVGQKSDYGISGLATAPSPVVGVPPGALKDADNCVIRRPGMIEGRPGFDISATLTLDEVWKLVTYADTYFAVGLKTSVFKTRWANDTLTDALFDKHYARGVEARKNLYLTTTDAMRKFTVANDTTAELVGRPQPLTVMALDDSAATVKGVLAASSVAYRATITRIDANNVESISQPSSRLVFTSTVARAPVITVVWTALQDVIVGDIVRLYRSVNVASSIVPPDEMFLAYEHVVTATDVSNKDVGFTDSRLDADLGVPLYTNATQDGDARANVQPPRPRDVALFAGSVFAADIMYPPLLEISWAETLPAAGTATGIGARPAFNATLTNGSATLTLAAAGDSVGWQVGMLLSSDKGNHWGGALVRITSVAGATIGLSASWTGTTTVVASVTAWDTIKIRGTTTEYYPTVFASYLLENIAGFNRTLAFVQPIYGLQASTQVLGQAVSDEVNYLDADAQTGNVRSVLLTRALPTQASFLVSATHGDEFTPALPLISSGNETSSAQDYFPNGVTWSKQEEPEHYMRGQLWLIGNGRSPILRIFALKDALYILKGKGDSVYRLTGFGERSGWNVQQLDTSTYLLHTELATVMGDAIYAWTNAGMVRIDASGVSDAISDPIKDLVGNQSIALDDGAASHSYAFAVADSTDSELLFGLPIGNVDGQAPANTWVYNTKNNAWTTWFGDATSPWTMAFDPQTRLLLTAGSGATVMGERDPNSSIVLNADITRTVTISAVTGLAVTIAGGSGWSPLVGDLVKKGATITIVTAVTDATHFTVQDAVTTGAASAYEGYYSTITWLPKLDPSGAIVKRYQSLVTHWDDIYGVYSWTQQVSGTRGNTANLLYTRVFEQAHKRKETRALLPANVALDSQLYPGILMHNAGAQWRITGMTENYEIATDRVSL